MIWDMLAAPEAHADPYVWGAALLGHFAIGVFLVAVFGLFARTWRAAAFATVGYLLGWEGLQMLFFGSSIADSLVDAAAVACGAVLAAGAWRNKGAAVAAALTILAGIGIRGINKRR